MGEKYQTNLAEVVGAFGADIGKGGGTLGPILRDLGDQHTPFSGVKEMFADAALQQFPAIYAAAMAELHAKAKAVELTAEAP